MRKLCDHFIFLKMFQGTSPGIKWKALNNSDEETSDGSDEVDGDTDDDGDNDKAGHSF